MINLRQGKIELEGKVAIVIDVSRFVIVYSKI